MRTSPDASALARPPRSRWLVPAAVAALLALGCSEAGPDGRTRVLLLGIDGATLRIIEPLMAAGRLPHLAALAEAGAHGPLRSHPPFQSPRVWTSIATGRRPDKHGIESFTTRTGDDAERLVASHDRVGPALWNIAHDRGLTAATVNWWVTYPPEKIAGVMVTDHFLPHVADGRARYFEAAQESGAPVVHPPEWRERVAAIVQAEESRPPARRFDANALPDWSDAEQLARWYVDDAIVGAIARAVDAELRPDVLMLLLKGVDAASHVLYATTVEPADLAAPLAGTDAQIDGGAEALYAFYQQTDAILGALLAGFDDDDLVLVVSDHGFDVRRNPGRLTGHHRSGAEAARAVIFARGPGIAPGARAEGVSVRDVTPTILAALGLPVAEDMDGAPAPFLAVAGGVAKVPTYAGRPIERYATQAGGQEQRILDQLEALGYFEPVDAEAPGAPH